MSWFCQGITEDGRLCWLPKGHDDIACQSAPLTAYSLPPGSDTFTVSYSSGNPTPMKMVKYPEGTKLYGDGSSQSVLPGL